MMSLFDTQFLAFIIVVRKNKWHFWNSETRLDKTDMHFYREILKTPFLKIQFDLTLTYSRVN